MKKHLHQLSPNFWSGVCMYRFEYWHQIYPDAVYLKITKEVNNERM